MTHSEDSDAALIERAIAGEQRAFQELVQRYRSSVYRSSFLILKHEDDAMDNTQEAFIRAFRSLASFESRSRFETWIKSIARNLALNRLRDHAKHKRTQTLGDRELRSAAQGAAEKLEANEVKTLIRSLVDELPESHSLPLKLFVIDGLSYREIAELLDLKVGTVNSRIHHAKKKLAVKLKSSLLGDSEGYAADREVSHDG